MDTVQAIFGARREPGARRDFRRQYQELVNECRDGIYQRSRDGRFLFVNPSFCKMLGYERSALLRMKLDDIRDLDDPSIGPVIEKMLSSDELPVLLTSRFKHRDGHWVPVETSARRLDDDRIQVTVRDITERHHAEAALSRQRDLYAALSETHKAIMTAESQAALFEQVCRIAVQYGKLHFASVSLIDPADRRLRPVARCGEDYGYTDSATIGTDAARPEGRGASGKAVCSGERQVSNDFLNDPCNAPWYEGARRAGIRASAALPLRQGGRIVGALGLYAAETGFFTDELLPTLDDIAAGLSHALDGFARETERRRAETALRISEERLRTLVQTTSQIIWITDARGVTVETSATYEELTGFARGEAREGIWLQTLHPDDREAATASWDYAFQNGVAYDLEARVRMRDGTYRWFAVHGQPIFEADGSIREWIGTCTDINTRKLAHQALRDSQRQYLELVEEARDGIYQRDVDGRFLFVDPALCEMLGYERDELLHTSIHKIMDMDEARVARCVENLNGTAEPTGLLEVRLKHRDGHWVTVETAGKRLGSGRIQVMVRDISARVEAQRHLEEERNFILQAINSLPGTFYVCDDQGRFLRWNGRLQQRSGYSFEEIKTMRPLELVPVEQRDQAAALIAAALTQGEADAEIDLLDRNGRRTPHYVNGRSFRWQGRLCVAGMGIDISERREAQQRERRYFNKARELSRRLLTAQEEERCSIARELHDEIGSALTVLQINLKRIEDSMDPQMRGLPQGCQSIVATLLKQIRTMSLDLRPSILDDLGLAPAVNWYARERLQAAGFEIELAAPLDIGRLPAEIESACFRVLQGAATNAQRHGHARKLEICLSRTPTALELMVRDDGDGFDVEAARKLAHNGASLGILAMEERMRLIGGELHLESAPGCGTTIHATVPLHEPEVDSRADAESRSAV